MSTLSGPDEGPSIDYDVMTGLSPHVVQVVDRDRAFWADHGPVIDRPSTRLHVLAYVRSGDGTLSVNSRVQRLSAGTVFHVPARSMMAIRVAADDPACFFSLHFLYAMVAWNGGTPTLTPGGARPLPLPRVAGLGGHPGVERSFARAFEVWSLAGSGYEWYAKAALVDILRMVCELTAPRTRDDSATSRAVDAALDHIKSHLDGPLDRARVARQVGLSPGYFSTVFKARTGYSFSSYVRGFRISEARRYLHSTDLSIQEIARRVGFCDPFHFSRVFRNVTGVPPREFREM